MSGPDYVYANGNGNGNGNGSANGGGSGGNRRRSSHNANGLSGGGLDSVYQPVNLFNGVEIQNILHNNFERYRSKAAVYTESVRRASAGGGEAARPSEEHEFTMVSSSNSGANANAAATATANSYGGERYGYDRAGYGGRKGKDLLSELSKSMMHMHPHTHKNSASSASSASASHYHYHHHYQQQQQQ